MCGNNFISILSIYLGSTWMPKGKLLTRRWKEWLITSIIFKTPPPMSVLLMRIKLYSAKIISISLIFSPKNLSKGSPELGSDKRSFSPDFVHQILECLTSIIHFKWIQLGGHKNYFSKLNSSILGWARILGKHLLANNSS